MIAPEAANNGVTSGTLVPTLALGVPGGSTAAVMMIVLQYHGMVMGPRLFATNPWRMACSSRWRWLTSSCSLPSPSRYMSRVVLIETTYLAPIIILVTIVAAFGERQYLFDMGLALVFGVIGYVAHKTNYHVTAILIGILLGPLFEQYLVRALRISQGDLTVLFSSTLGNVLWGLLVLSLAAALAQLRAEEESARRMTPLERRQPAPSRNTPVARNTGAAPSAVPKPPKASGTAICVILFAMIRMPRASPERPAGAWL